MIIGHSDGKYQFSEDKTMKDSYLSAQYIEENLNLQNMLKL